MTYKYPKKFPIWIFSGIQTNKKGVSERHPQYYSKFINEPVSIS